MALYECIIYILIMSNTACIGNSTRSHDVIYAHCLSLECSPVNISTTTAPPTQETPATDSSGEFHII